MVEMTFVFSMIWSVCASVDEDGRKKIDSYLREIEGSFPNKVRALEAQCPVGPIFPRLARHLWSSDCLTLHPAATLLFACQCGRPPLPRRSLEEGLVT